MGDICTHGDIAHPQGSRWPSAWHPFTHIPAWFESQHGPQAYADMVLIPRAMWMDYLVWYRSILNLDVANETTLLGFDFRDDGLIELDLADRDGATRVLARRVVLATGLDGLGAPTLPDVAQRIPARFIRHGADAIDMAAIKGKRVAVVGAGASAMDNAAAALEAGAAQVDIFVRRADIPPHRQVYRRWQPRHDPWLCRSAGCRQMGLYGRRRAGANSAAAP